MRGVNKVILVGNLGSDPEVRYSQSGDAIANFSVATTESWKDKGGEQQEKTEWHRVVAFKRLGEIVGEYLKKGSQVYIEGKLQTRKWQDNDGNDRYSTEIVASQMQMLGSRSDDLNDRYEKGDRVAYEIKHENAGDRNPVQYKPTPPQSDFDDDIPF